MESKIYLLPSLRFLFEISYNGGHYHGWQIQPNAITIQEEINNALSTLLREKINVVGCGRTDTGVHASQYFLHFNTTHELVDKDVFKLNQMLPQHIAIHAYRQTSERFHARFDATYRKYIYKVHFKKNPFLYGTSLFLFVQPDIELMNKACALLLKEKDFASFCKSGGDNKTTLCDLFEAKWVETNDGYEFHVAANRFLRNMVRALVGTLLEVGYGNVDLPKLEEIIAAKNRSAAGKSVAAHGLYLAEVGYPNE